MLTFATSSAANWRSALAASSLQRGSSPAIAASRASMLYSPATRTGWPVSSASRSPSVAVSVAARNLVRQKFAHDRPSDSGARKRITPWVRQAWAVVSIRSRALSKSPISRAMLAA